MADTATRRTAEWQRVAVAIAAWSFAYAAYRAYYAVGGELGMIGEPVSRAQFRAINAAGATIIFVAGIVPLAALWLNTVRRGLPVLRWTAAVSCCMQASACSAALASSARSAGGDPRPLAGTSSGT